MSRKRIAFLTSRFWPISGVSQILAGELAVGLRDLGSEVEIITSRWEHRWNKSFSFRGIPVHRLPTSSSGPWGNFRTQRALSKQLNANWDAIVICGIEDHLDSAVRSQAKSNAQVILRLDDHASMEPLWPHNLGRKTVAALETVDAIVCTNASIRSQLHRVGIDDGKVHVIPDGVPSATTQSRTLNLKSQFRSALSDAHPVLAIEPDEPLVVTGVPFQGDPGIYQLIEAWRSVVKQYPRSRLWLLGDGPQAREIWDHITKANLVYSIIMPGFFDNLDDPLYAADLYVHPAQSSVGHACLARAMANGVCPVSRSSLDGLIENQKNGLVVSGDAQALAQSILGLIADGNLRNRFGDEAQQSVHKQLSFDSTLDHYVRLIQGNLETASCETVN